MFSKNRIAISIDDYDLDATSGYEVKLHDEVIHIDGDLIVHGIVTNIDCDDYKISQSSMSEVLRLVIPDKFKAFANCIDETMYIADMLWLLGYRHRTLFIDDVSETYEQSETGDIVDETYNFHMFPYVDETMCNWIAEHPKMGDVMTIPTIETDDSTKLRFAIHQPEALVAHLVGGMYIPSELSDIVKGIEKRTVTLDRNGIISNKLDK